MPAAGCPWSGRRTSSPWRCGNRSHSLTVRGDGSWRLNDLDRGRQYAGRWHTAAADQDVAKVKGYLDQRTWESPDSQEA
jgi:hypothetical protein